ncbi:MAG: energy-coupling factor transporter transmembrane protein EcfT [Blautia sp.]|nr:energy-coupling factor transporter transmembrane protein EcfT [Blautia sp.]MDY5030299.1 energy-coupling factor transporter transmembrane component T [Blautia sp.]
MRFDSYHPVINFIYFTVALACAVQFDHPVFLVISYLAAFFYSIKLNGVRSFVFNLCLIPFIAAYAIYYSYYNHFGVTALRTNFIGNRITLEALTVGLVRGVMAASVLMIFSCIFTLVSADKIVYLFGRISPKLSLYLSILLRFVPRVKQRAAKTELSRRGIGKGCFQGNLVCRLKNCGSFISILVTWTLEDFMESAQSMKCRGYSLRGRTAFSIYRFDNRDRGLVLVMSLCITLMTAAEAFDQTGILYDPEIVMNRITPLSCVFYAAYALFLLLPMFLQIAEEKRYPSGSVS